MKLFMALVGSPSPVHQSAADSDQPAAGLPGKNETNETQSAAFAFYKIVVNFFALR